MWADGDLAVVMVQGREFRYDLRHNGETIEQVKATRNWRQERQMLIERAAWRRPTETACAAA
ncbi:MAG: hypothetical protein EI684_06360 [Candidatus Viridilinea halotolerans]|uniref:Uncharacterized protein n=1 Tax=Candidatus Viridilinea halotolerans TaxID=2491704 RepID=A0A426U4B1_9CHLR|nr:MAG: hypothetical protein EI684_06360 [Candidatus Viridilinea halotolerans]